MKYEIWRGQVRIGSLILLQHEVEELISSIDSVITDMAHTGAKFYHHDIEVTDATLRIGCREFTIDEYRQFKEDWAEAQKEEEGYDTGQRFIHTPSGNEYILACVSETKANLVNLKTGFRWGEARTVKNFDNISLQEVVGGNASLFQPINEGATS